jgi:hypothetical protein
MKMKNHGGIEPHGVSKVSNASLEENCTVDEKTTIIVVVVVL